GTPQVSSAQKPSSKCCCPEPRGDIETAIMTSRFFVCIIHWHRARSYRDGQSTALLAASSFFTLKDVSVADNLVGAAINVLPVSNDRTVAIFSYPSKDRGTVRAVLDRILSAQGQYQKYELSKLILSRISNVLISPRHFKNWGESKANKITFVKMLHTRQDV